MFLGFQQVQEYKDILWSNFSFWDVRGVKATRHLWCQKAAWLSSWSFAWETQLGHQKGLKDTQLNMGKGAMIFILSQKGYGICIFETPHDDMKFCWSIKESYLNAKIAYAQGLTVNRLFFTSSLLSFLSLLLLY